MIRRAFLLAVAILFYGGAAQAQAQGDPRKGQQIFARCRACHTVGPNAHAELGPPLNGIVGRKWASEPGFSYSPALIAGRGKGRVWDEATLDKWLENPRALVSGTKMIFIGLHDEQQREDVIAYLKQFAAGEKAR